MEPLELFAILVLAGAIIVLLYYYLREINKTGNTSFDTVKSSISDAGARFSEGINQQYNSQSSKGERMSGVSERVSEMSEKLKGKVRDVPISTDVLSGRIDEFLNDQSDQLIKDWELATKTDINALEKRYTKVSRDVDGLAKRFDEFRNHANKKFEYIEERLEKLEETDSSKE